MSYMQPCHNMELPQVSIISIQLAMGSVGRFSILVLAATTMALMAVLSISVTV